jgi:hypothetical protein
MSPVYGKRDNLIMSTVPRYSTPIDRALLLTASATMFEVSIAGAPTPETITFSALMLGAVGEIAFSSEPPVKLTVANGDAVLKFEDMTASIVTVSASTVIDGLTYYARQTLAKQQALDLRPPPAPTGLVATGHPATISLAWGAVPANYNNLSHTEVWRAPVNDFSKAVLAGRADGREYIDPVGPGAFRYYWIRYVSRASIPGPYNASSGTVGASDVEVEHLLQVLTDQITKEQLNSGLSAKIDLIDELDEAYGDTASAATSAAAAIAAAAAADLAQQKADTAAGKGGQFAGQAAESATSASTSAANASTFSREASQAASNAGSSTAAAEVSAGVASQAKLAAGNSATAAAGSSQSAAGYATAAETASSASSASKISAEAARDGAAQSAQAASGSAGTAAAKASEAGQSATAANNAATTAGTRAADAGSYASQAAQSAANADGSAQASAQFLQQAQAILIDPITGLVDKYAAVKVQADATADSVKGVVAKYGVQVDADGVSGGFELIGGGGQINFGVRASTFFIASPIGSGIPSAIPFIVRTTEIVIGGVPIPIGVYISDAFIQNASITNAKIGGDIWSSNYVAGQAGWRLSRAGNMEVNNLQARGQIAGGAMTGWEWPTNGGTGYYLGSNGLRLGNPSTGRYAAIFQNGDIDTPQFKTVGGKAEFTGDILTGVAPGFRIEMGPGDPIYAMWAGSGAKNDTNAIFFLKRSGAGYFGGSLSAGTLRTAVTNPSVGPSQQVVSGPFGSNGGGITVIGSIAFYSSERSYNHNYSAGAGTTSCSFTLFRKLGTDPEVQIHTFYVGGSIDFDNHNPTDELSSGTISVNGSFTFVDPVSSTVSRTYRLVSNLTYQQLVATRKPGGGTSFAGGDVSQRLTLITTE